MDGEMMTRKLTTLLLSLLLTLSLLPVSARAGNDSGSEREDLVEVVWNGVTSGPACDATVTLYKYKSSDPIDDEYHRMWGTFRLVMTDAAGNVLLDEGFDTPSKSISLTEPGDYYCSVYSNRGDLQGLSNGSGGYSPFTQHFCVTAPYEPSVYEELTGNFVVSCMEYPDDHDRAFREYLAILHGIAGEVDGFSLTDCADYMADAMAAYPDAEYADLYNEFRSNESYALMEVTPLGVYDPIILTDEETYAFWAGECWNYLVNGEEIIFNEDGTMYPYADHLADLDPFAEDSIDETASEESASPQDSGSSLPLIAGGAAAVIVCASAAVILTRKKNAKKN